MRKLEAINEIIVVGLSLEPIASEDLDNPAYIKGNTYLNISLNEFKSNDFFKSMFETEEELIFDSNGYIFVPYGTNYIEPIDPGIKVRVIDNKLYDVLNKTYKFKQNLKCRIVRISEFDLMEDQIQQVIVKKATLIAITKESPNDLQAIRVCMDSFNFYYRNLQQNMIDKLNPDFYQNIPYGYGSTVNNWRDLI